MPDTCCLNSLNLLGHPEVPVGRCCFNERGASGGVVSAAWRSLPCESSINTGLRIKHRCEPEEVQPSPIRFQLSQVYFDVFLDSRSYLERGRMLVADAFPPWGQLHAALH